MEKESWLNIRERAVHGDITAITDAFNFYCKTNSLRPNPREMQVIQKLLSIKALIRWVDVQLGVHTITDKKGFIVKVL